MNETVITIMLRRLVKVGLYLLHRGKHPYVAAVKDLTRITVARFDNPLLLIDWIFYLTAKGKRFKEALSIVHDQAEMVSC